MSAPHKGWAWPYGCSEPHYFVGPLSLCGGARLIDADNERINSRVVDKKDCAECVALLFPNAKQKRATAKGAK